MDPTTDPVAAAVTAVAPATINGAFTDNYKWAYNQDVPSELRAWFGFSSIVAGGVTYSPLYPDTIIQPGTVLEVVGSDGSRAQLTVSTASPNVMLNAFRSEPTTKHFGLLQQLKAKMTPTSAPVVQTLSIVKNGATVASTDIEYRYDAIADTTVQTNIEFNGPAGRFYLGGQPTRLDWEKAPTISSVTAPATTTSLTINVGITATDDFQVKDARFANSDGTWSAWKPYTSTMAWTLSSTAATKTFKVQVRDNAGLLSNEVTKTVTYTAPTAAPHDLNSDGKNDVLVRKTDGTLVIKRGNGTGGFLADMVVPGTFSAYNKVLLSKDMNGDGRADVVARKTADGTLWLFPGNGAGGFTTAKQILGNWASFTELVTPGDFSGDGKADILARRTDGTLWLYKGNGTGGWSGYVQVPGDFKTVKMIIGPGDFSGDGKTDLMTLEADGHLMLREGNGTGGFRIAGYWIRSGWTDVTAIATPGDFDGDKKVDILPRRGDGTLWLFAGDGWTGWKTNRSISAGWATLNAIL